MDNKIDKAPHLVQKNKMSCAKPLHLSSIRKSEPSDLMIGQVPTLTSLKRRPDELKIPRSKENEENESGGREVQSSQRKKKRNVPDLLSGMN